MVLDRLIKYSIRVNKEKSQWMKTLVNFLGHSISQEGLRPTATKITDIINFTEPKSVDQVRSFLGVRSFYRKFIPQLAQEAQSVYSFLRKKSTFEWTVECGDTFVCIKNKLVEAQLLHYPDFTKPSAIQSDAARRGIGFVLMQEKDGEIVPIQYGGRTLTKTEVNYCNTDKELLAVFHSVKKCEVYVLRHAFLVYTDHKPLLYLQTLRDKRQKVVIDTIPRGNEHQNKVHLWKRKYNRRFY